MAPKKLTIMKTRLIELEREIDKVKNHLAGIEAIQVELQEQIRVFEITATPTRKRRQSKADEISRESHLSTSKHRRSARNSANQSCKKTTPNLFDFSTDNYTETSSVYSKSGYNLRGKTQKLNFSAVSNNISTSSKTQFFTATNLTVPVAPKPTVSTASKAISSKEDSGSIAGKRAYYAEQMLRNPNSQKKQVNEKSPCPTCRNEVGNFDVHFMKEPQNCLFNGCHFQTHCRYQFFLKHRHSKVTPKAVLFSKHQGPNQNSKFLNVCTHCDVSPFYEDLGSLVNHIFEVGHTGFNGIVA